MAKSHYVPGTATVDHVDIKIKSNALWGWCNEVFEIVAVIVHELGHAAPAGTYVCGLSFGGVTVARKLVIVR